jgi:hypothetical protein
MEEVGFRGVSETGVHTEIMCAFRFPIQNAIKYHTLVHGHSVQTQQANPDKEAEFGG